MDSNKWLTVKQTAEMLGIHPHTIYNGIAEKTDRPFPIKPIRIGRAIRFPMERIREYMEA